MRRFTAFTLLGVYSVMFLCLSHFAMAADRGDEMIVIPVGNGIERHASRSQMIRVGDGKIIKVEDLGSKIRIFGRKTGQTSIRIGPKNYHVHVIPVEAAQLFSKLQTLLNGKMGLELAVEDDQVVVEGLLLRLEDWQDIADITADQGPYRFSATLDPTIKKSVQTHFDKLLTIHRLPARPLLFSPNASLAIPDDHKRFIKDYERVLSPWGIQITSKA